MKRILCATILFTLLTLIAVPAKAADSVHRFPNSNVLIIGDSHTVASSLYGGYRNWDVDARVGRGSSEGVNVLRANIEKRHRVVVFDLATNDYYQPNTLQSNLEKVHQIAGHRRLIVVNSRIGCGSENKATKVNNVVRNFANKYNYYTRMADWSKYTGKHKNLFGSDCIHYTAKGYQIRIDRISNIIRSELIKATRN